jgi:hypothetical protein
VIALAGLAITVGVVNDHGRQPLYRGYVLADRGLGVRAEPKLSSPSVSFLAARTAVYIVCTAIGDMVTGPGANGGPPQSTPLWDQVRTEIDGNNLGFVPDAWVNTEGTAPRGPTCKR